MATDVQTIMKLSVPVIVEIGRRYMSLENVLKLAPGAIIELPKSADEKLDLLVNNKTVACGTAVKVGENFGIRVESAGSTRQRIEAMRS